MSFKIDAMTVLVIVFGLGTAVTGTVQFLIS